MGRALRILGGLLLVSLAALGAVIVAGQRGFPVPARSDLVLDLGQLRELAHVRQGKLPSALNALVVGRATLPRGAIVAGASWLEGVPRVFPSFQIAYEDGSSIL